MLKTNRHRSHHFSDEVYKAREVTFETVITKCGPQLRYGDFTLNLDGEELVRYSPCYANLGFVNVNGKAFTFRNSTWEPMAIEKILPTEQVTADFKYSDVLFKPAGQHKNPSYTDAMFSHMNVMADIVATMSEHATWDGLQQQTASAAKLLFTDSDEFSNLSMFDKISYYVAIFCSFLVFVVVLRICYACGVHILLYKMLCKPLKRPMQDQVVKNIPMVSLSP